MLVCIYGVVDFAREPALLLLVFSFWVVSAFSFHSVDVRDDGDGKWVRSGNGDGDV